MRLKTKLWSITCMALAWLGTAEAALVDRGSGLIYDTVLNVTWLQNANLAAGSAYDDGELPNDGIMTWVNAMAWVNDLSYFDSVRGVTYNDWRLPQVRPVNGTAFDYTDTNDGSSDIGFNLSAPGSAYPGSTASELAYMYYTNLGNLGFNDLSGNFQPDHGLVNTGPFLNLDSRGYWSGNEAGPDPVTYVFFLAGYGVQTNVGKGDFFTPWAVRDGDVQVAVPLPAAAWLLGSALAGGWVLRRRKQA